MKRQITSLAAGWNDFWFTPQSTAALGLFRIAFGFLATVWTLCLAPNLLDFYGPSGILPEYPAGPGNTWGILALSSSAFMCWALFIATLAGSIALMLGWHSRVAAVVVFLGMISFEHRNLLVLNSGDSLVRCMAVYCMLAPSGTALSLDRRREAPDRFWEFPARAPWALRLVQLTLSLGYLAAVWDKMQGDLWRNGTAVSYAMRIEDIHRIPTPAFITESVVISELATFGTLALELSLGILVWNRALRPWLLAMGIVMHVMIDLSVLVGYFSAIMLVGYIAFIPPETADRYVLAARDRFTALRDRVLANRRGTPIATSDATVPDNVGVDPLDRLVPTAPDVEVPAQGSLQPASERSDVLVPSDNGAPREAGELSAVNGHREPASQ
jgi:hypothetical protein